MSRSVRELILGAIQKGTEQGSDAYRDIEKAKMDPLRALLLQQTQADRKQKALDQGNERLGARVTREDLPSMRANLGGLEAATADPKTGKGMLSDANYQPKSTGPVLNTIGSLLGDTAKGAAITMGEKLGMVPKGAGVESQHIQRLMNIDTNKLFGASQSKAEMGKQMISSGMAAGGDPTAIREGMRMLEDAYNESVKNIKASTNQDVLKQYAAQGGQLDLPYQASERTISVPPGGGGDRVARQNRIKQLKAKLGQR